MGKGSRPTPSSHGESRWPHPPCPNDDSETQAYTEGIPLDLV